MQHHDFIQLLFLLALGACSVCSAQTLPETARQHGLQFSARLLQLASTVIGGK